MLHRGQVVRHQIRPQLISFVNHHPELAGVWLDGQRRRVAQPRGIRLVGAGLGVDLPHLSAVGFNLQTAFGDVAVGTDTHVQRAAIRADGQCFGPVVVDGRGQIRQLDGGATGLGLTVFIIEAHQCVLIGDVDFAIGIGQPVGCIKVLGKHRFDFVNTVAVSIAQQGQAIAAFDLRVALRLDVTGNHILGFEFGRITATPLGHENVAIGQDQGLTRDFQVSGNRRDRIALGHGGLLLRPLHRLGDFHAGQQATLWLGQIRIRAYRQLTVGFAATGA